MLLQSRAHADLTRRVNAGPRSVSRHTASRQPFSAPATEHHATGARRGAPARRALASRVMEGESGVSTSNEAPSTAGPRSTVWELDFCSRPLLDERGKKVWELLICDPNRSFEYSQYFPNNKINSSELRKALEAVLAQPGAVKPDKVKFFRAQMQTIISRALGDLEIKAVPSRRCFALMAWLEERLESVYKRDERYSDAQPSLFGLELAAPKDLPDALRGEQWTFVQLPLSVLMDELSEVQKGNIFGTAFDLSRTSAADLAPDTMVPGVAVFSRRAMPMAAWTNALELACLRADVDRACLLLESGVRDCWRYAAFRRAPENTAEAQAWEDAKQATKGLHFLAIQEHPDAERCSGMWLLLDRAAPSV